MSEEVMSEACYRELLFARGNYGCLYLCDGWAHPETWGVKNSSNICSIKLPLFNTNTAKINIYFVCKCLGEVEVWLNEIRVDLWCGDKSAKKYIEKSFEIDSHLISKNRYLTFKTRSQGDFELLSLQFDSPYISVKKTDYSIVIKNKFGLEISRDINPIFLTGIPRSGTTIVYKVINSLVNQKKQSLVESFFFLYLFGGHQNKFYKDCTLTFLGENSIQVDTFQFIQEGLISDLNKDTALDIVREYFALAADYYECDTIIEKTPDHIFYWRVIFDAFYKSKIVFCMRDAVDVYASMRKRLIGLSDEDKKIAENSWLSMSCNDFISFYEQYLMAYKQCSSANSEKVFLLDYHKFVSRNPELLHDFAEFLNCETSQLFKALDEPFGGTKNQGNLLSDRVLENKINPEHFISQADLKILNSYFHSN